MKTEQATRVGEKKRDAGDGGKTLENWKTKQDTANDATKAGGENRCLYFLLFSLFQVTVPSTGTRGFLDASEYGNWLKFVRAVDDAAILGAAPNVKHVLMAGQVRQLYCRNVFVPYFTPLLLPDLLRDYSPRAQGRGAPSPS